MGAPGEEQQWIQRSREGDPAAFEALIERHQRMIHALTYRMTGTQADAQDLAQETFIQAYRQLGSFRGDASFSSWLSRIAINTSLNWLKRNTRRARLHETWSAQATDSSAREHRLAAVVEEALLQLPPKQRAAVVLTTYEGLNHAEAGRVLNCSETTVSWRLFAARQKLKHLLREFAGGSA